MCSRSGRPCLQFCLSSSDWPGRLPLRGWLSRL